MDVFFALLVCGNVLATSYLWQTMKRGPKRKFLTMLLRGKPIEPKHRRPPRPDALPAQLFVSNEYREFFQDFDIFADLLNSHCESNYPVRLQELPDPDIGSQDGPLYGRRYQIFYNTIVVGLMEIHPGDQYSHDDPIVHTRIEVRYARLLPFYAISNLVSAIARFTTNIDEFKQAMTNLYGEAIAQLWQIEYDPTLDERNDGGTIEVGFDGSAKHWVEWKSEYGEQWKAKYGGGSWAT